MFIYNVHVLSLFQFKFCLLFSIEIKSNKERDNVDIQSEL